VFVVMIPLYTVAESGGRRRSLVVGAGTAVGLVAVIVLVEGDEGAAGQVALRLVLALSALVVGEAVRTTRSRTRWRPSTSAPASPHASAARRTGPRRCTTSRRSRPRRCATCGRR
jgi:predicted lipid-binding transport protein (Tim44 family)